MHDILKASTDTGIKRCEMQKIKIKLPGMNEFFTKEAYKTLRTNIQFCGQDVKTITVTSCNENEGKSTVTLHIAKSFAELGKKVLVVDADMRKSVIANRNSNARKTTGLSEVLTGQADFQESLCVTQFDGMHILFSGKYPPNPVELLGSKYFSEFLSKVREKYDYVLIDTPPLSQVIDSAIVAAECDGTILVIASEKTHYRQVFDALDQLKRSDCRILGAVRNCADNKGKKRYGSKKGYYYQYGSSSK